MKEFLLNIIQEMTYDEDEVSAALSGHEGYIQTSRGQGEVQASGIMGTRMMLTGFDHDEVR